MGEIKVPELAESITEGTISEWLKKVGDKIERGEYIAELETDKVNVEITAEESGVITEFLKEPGDTVHVGEVIARLDESGEGGGESASSSAPEAKEEASQEKAPEAEAPKESTTAVATKEVPKEEAKSTSRTIASPAARKLARERGIKLDDVKTTDPMGRVRKHDIESHENKPAAKGQSAPQPQKQVQPQDPQKPEERIKMTRRRQTIVRKFPLLNAEIQGNELVLKKYYDIGVAVSTDDGLVVPVVRDADRKTFSDIEGDILDKAKKARDNKLTLKDLQGGTFTITNGGVFGSLLSTPILNGPQVGILGMHKIQLRPVAIDEERSENRPMMYIALSYDHRIVDGKEAVSFLATIKDLLEDPETLLLEG
ncbi:2-oxo acid dehydrogenase subunit E2 [Priestia filamentosa]|nr:2-oxo acid dehydrogenase subunit E2 [Priestia filamentosa]